MAKQRFFAKKLRYRENSLLRPKRYGDGTNGIDTKPIEEELERRITTHAKDAETQGDNQLVRGHKRFNDTVQMVDRDPFYSGYLPYQRAYDTDGNVYTDDGKFPAMSLFTKNRILSEEPEMLTGRTSYSGIGLSTSTFSGLGEDAMMRNAKAGLLFSSVFSDENKWETDAMLRSTRHGVYVGNKQEEGVSLIVKNVAKSIYKTPVKSLSRGSRMLLLLLLESFQWENKEDEAEQKVKFLDGGDTFAKRIQELIDPSKLTSDVLNLVPDTLPLFDEVSDDGKVTESEREIYRWCHEKTVTNTPSLSKIAEHLNTKVITSDDMDESRKRETMTNYLTFLTYTMISRMGTDENPDIERLLPYDSISAWNNSHNADMNHEELLRLFLNNFSSNMGLANGFLYGKYPWEAVFDTSGNRACVNALKTWFSEGDRTLGKLMNVIAPLQGKLLNYLDFMLEKHGFLSGDDTPLYEILDGGLGYVKKYGNTLIEESSGDESIDALINGLKESRNSDLKDLYKEFDEAVSEVLSMGWLLVLFLFLPLIVVLCVFVIRLMATMFYMQVNSHEDNTQMAGILSRIAIASRSGSAPSVTFHDVNMTVNQLRFTVMASSMPWFTKLTNSTSGTSGNSSFTETLSKAHVLLCASRILSSSLVYIEDAWDDGGIRMTGKDGNVTIQPYSEKTSTVDITGMNIISAKTLRAENIECDSALTRISDMLYNGDSKVMEVPVGGIVMAVPHKDFSTFSLNFSSGNLVNIPMTVEACESEEDVVHCGCMPFRMARFNMTENLWTGGEDTPVIKGGTYRLLTMLPTGMASSSGYSKYLKAPILMQRVSEEIRQIRLRNLCLCIYHKDDHKINNSYLHAKTRIYPRHTFMNNCMMLDDGTIVESREKGKSNKQITRGVAYLQKVTETMETEASSSYGDYTIKIGEFAVSAFRFKRDRTGKRDISNFFAGRDIHPENFKYGSEWDIDSLEYGIYYKNEGKFKSYVTIVKDGQTASEESVSSNWWWVALEDTPVIIKSDTNTHYMYAAMYEYEVPLSDCAVYSVEDGIRINEREPTELYPKGKVIVVKQLGGRIRIYATSDGAWWSGSQFYADDNYLNIALQDFPDAFKGDNVGENVDIIMCHHALFSGSHTMSRLNKVTETTQIYKNATKDFPDGNFPESSSGMFS